MTEHLPRVLALSVVAGLTAVVPASLAGQQSRPVFRATTSLVAVPVFVEDGNRPVIDLDTTGFELRDNGVRQKIEYVADSSTPIDVTIVVDSSVPEGRELDQFVRDVTRLEDVLDEADRVRVLTFDMSLVQQLPWSGPGRLAPLTGLRPGGRGTHADAIAASLIGSVNPERRHLVTFFTDGLENHSGVDLSRVLDLATRTRAVLYTYALDLSRPLEHVGGMDRYGNLISRTPSVFRPVRITKVAAERLEALEEAARLTGGQPGDFRGSAFSSVRDVLGKFRRGYTLYFSPTSGADDSWHELSVPVIAPGGADYRVDARPGYTSSVSGAPTPQVTENRLRSVAPLDPSGLERSEVAIEAPGSSASRATEDQIRSLLVLYERGEHASVAATIRAFSDAGETARLVQDVGQRWIDESDVGSLSHRRVVVASLALEFASPSFPVPFIKTEQYRTWNDEIRPLVIWAKEILSQNLGVHAAERAWYLAAIAGFQGMLAFRHDMRHRAEAEALLAQAISRVPDEARSRWADAQMVEQLWDARAVTRRARPDEVRKAYETATSRSDDDLRAEIQMHVVSRYLQANSDAEALGPIVDLTRREAAQEALARTVYAEQMAREPFLVYMCRFLRARLYDRLDIRPEAEAAYRSALEVYPHAQSASMPLATLLFLRGQEAAAQVLVDDVLANPGADDPWRIYFLQDYRRLPMYIEQMRAALQASR